MKWTYVPEDAEHWKHVRALPFEILTESQQDFIRKQMAEEFGPNHKIQSFDLFVTEEHCIFCGRSIIPGKPCLEVHQSHYKRPMHPLWFPVLFAAGVLTGLLAHFR